MRPFLHASGLVLSLMVNPCHRDPPEVERFLGDWAPHALNKHYSGEFKSGGRYVLHSDTGNVEGTWELNESTADTAVIATQVGEQTDRIQLKFRDDGTVVWTSLNTNEGDIRERR